jgi:hypothetical protein
MTWPASCRAAGEWTTGATHHSPFSNDATGVFNDHVQVAGSLRTWLTDFDDPADATGCAYYIVPMDGDGNPLTPQSNTVSF